MKKLSIDWKGKIKTFEVVEIKSYRETSESKELVRYYFANDFMVNSITITSSKKLDPLLSRRLSRAEVWYDNLINNILPELGEEYMCLFIDCGFEPFLFMQIVDNLGELKIKEKINEN